LKNKIIRLVKVISRSGFCSRREAEKLIDNGEVFVDGVAYKNHIISLDKINKIYINKKNIVIPPTRVWCFNKSVGLICSNKNQYGKKRIFDMLPEYLPRVVSVGRLDLNSEGLLLLTNDTELSSYLENPKNKILRKYLVTVQGDIKKIDIDALKKGVKINGMNYQSIDLKIIQEKKTHILKFGLKEGKNREIRKICSFYKLKIKQLKRIQFGPFKIDSLTLNNILEINRIDLKKKLKELGFKSENYFR
tara:strand:+ start:235 stop:978 length:744 start_codon:yes stop_codon:yes gene_type:complete